MTAGRGGGWHFLSCNQRDISPANHLKFGSFSTISNDDFNLPDANVTFMTVCSQQDLFSMLRVVRWVAFAAIAGLIIAWGGLWLRGMGDGAGPAVAGLPGGVEVGGPFTLQDAEGRKVTDADFRGRWMLVYFGYSTCPDVCPTELQTLVSSVDTLGALASKVAMLFITVDPDRDHGAALAEYTKLFDPKLIGLTGTPQQIAAAAKAYRVYYAKVTPKESSTYLMDHSSFIYLMGPDGHLRALFRQGATGQDIADALRTRINAS